MTVERFFNENRVAIKVEMEIGSNEAIKQAIVGGLGVQYCPAFGTGSTKGPLTILDVEGFPIQCHWYVVYPASKQLSVVANTFHLLAEGRHIAGQVDLELMQKL